MPSASVDSFELLIGEQLSAVSFVMDYVEFHFDGHVVRALTNPCVTSAKGEIVFPAQGSKDALCGLIGATVTSISFQENIELRLSFVDHGELILPLDTNVIHGQEALHWQPMGGLMYVV